MFRGLRHPPPQREAVAPRLVASQLAAPQLVAPRQTWKPLLGPELCIYLNIDYPSIPGLGRSSVRGLTALRPGLGRVVSQPLRFTTLVPGGPYTTGPRCILHHLSFAQLLRLKLPGVADASCAAYAHGAVVAVCSSYCCCSFCRRGLRQLLLLNHIFGYRFPIANIRQELSAPFLISQLSFFFHFLTTFSPSQVTVACSRRWFLV